MPPERLLLLLVAALPLITGCGNLAGGAPAESPGGMAVAAGNDRVVGHLEALDQLGSALPAEQAALTEGFAAAMYRLADQTEEALPHALRARDRAREALGLWPGPGARRTHIAALIQLARIEQALGDYGNAALHLAEAQAAVDDGAAEDVADAFRADLAAVRAAQPTLH